MDFALSPEQVELRESTIRFARRELADDLLGRDARGEFSRALWGKCAAFGIQGLFVPTEHGGSGFDALTTIVALEALGYACKDNGLLFSLNAQMWSCELPLLKVGREEQKRRYPPGSATGPSSASRRCPNRGRDRTPSACAPPPSCGATAIC